MSRRHKKPLPAAPVEVTIERLDQEGRGVAQVAGKVTFVDGALPGERVLFTYVALHRNYDLGRAVEVLEPAPERVAPRCPHFGVCGGCSLQHLDPAAQIAAKERVLLEDLRRIGKVVPAEVLPPLIAPVWGYRRKARLGVRYVRKKERLLVGFRERNAPYVAELSRCAVLAPVVGERLADLAALIASLRTYDRIAQVEVALGDDGGALVFRNLVELEAEDRAALAAFGAGCGLDIYLQPGGPESVVPLGAARELSYRLPEAGVELFFGPGNFTQVNAGINRPMVARALELLDPQPGERILDLFCGLGNFTLPLARRAGHVIGVEGAAALVAQAEENARRNGIVNVEFHAADLAAPLERQPWLAAGVDKILLDPPRSGALEVLPHLAALGARRLLYISCNPATLARDAGELVQRYGWRLARAGVMDMFPHTAHVESIALFERGR